MKSQLKIGAFLIMHNEVDAAIRTAKSYLDVYPKGDLRILGNLSEKHPEVGLALGLPTYSSVPYIGPLHELEKLPRESWSPVTVVELVEIQLANIMLGMSNVESDFMLYLHPDHFLRKPIRSKNLPDLEMTLPNKYQDMHSKRMSEINPALASLKRYGIPGLMKVDSFFECYDFFKANRELFVRISNATENLIAYDDYLLPILYTLCGKRLANHHITREILRRPTVRDYFAPLLHQVRN